MDKEDSLTYLHDEETFLPELSAHSDLEQFLMTAEELEDRHAHHLYCRQKLQEWARRLA